MSIRPESDVAIARRWRFASKGRGAAWRAATLGLLSALFGPPARGEPDRPSGSAELLDSAPRNAPLVVYAPSVLSALKLMDRALDASESLSPRMARRWNRAFEGLHPGWGHPDERRSPRVTERAWLERVGIDPAGSLVILPLLDQEVAVVSFGLSSKELFRSALGAASGDEGRTVELDGVDGWMLGYDTGHPVTCGAGANERGFCQLGLARGRDPLAPLKTALHAAHTSHAANTAHAAHAHRTRIGQGPTSAGAVRSLASLPEGAELYIVARVGTLAPMLSRLLSERIRDAHRFDNKDAKILGRMRSQLLRSVSRKVSLWFDDLAVGIYSKESSLAVEAHIALTREGGSWFGEITDKATRPAVVSDWAATPALARILVRAKPKALESAAAAMLGVTVPPGELSGTVAMLFLGVDPECEAAKTGQSDLDFAFVVPTAVAIGLDGDPRRFAKWLTAALEGSRAVVTDGSPGIGSPPGTGTLPEPLASEAVDVRPTEHLVVVGTGRGAGAAAMRRLGSARAQGGPSSDPAFLEASADLAALDAALGAATLGPSHRSQLREAEAARERLRPFFRDLSTVVLRASHPEARRLRIEVRVDSSPPGSHIPSVLP